MNLSKKLFFFKSSPSCPEAYDWSTLYPNVINSNSEIYNKRVEMLDIGCGYGGLLSKYWVVVKIMCICYYMKIIYLFFSYFIAYVSECYDSWDGD